jgi:CelD/BcsL family acetyltransferase involved in cellulose biosynthesis
LGPPEGQCRILALYADGRVIGLWPLNLQGDTARFLGNADVCDYQDIVVADGCEQAMVDRVTAFLHTNGIRKLDLKSLRPEAAVLRAAKNLAAQERFGMTLYPHDVTYEMALPDNWQAFLMQLDSKQRHEVRRKLRRLEASGSVELILAKGPQGLGEATEILIDLFGRNRPDKAEFMTGPMTGYFRQLIETMAEYGMARLFVIKVDQKPAAAVLCFDYNGVRYLYNNGYDETFGRLSIGILSKVFSIKDGIQAGCRRYDFLKGSEVYKKRIGGKQLPLYRCEIQL